LISRMLPATILIVPLYIFFCKLNLLNTYFSIIAVYTAIALPLAVWLFRGFYTTIPIQIEEAAAIDGCSQLQVLLKVTLPLLSPGIGAVSMYVFLFAWNQFLLALVLANSTEVRPLSVTLLFYMSDYYVEWGSLFAASILMVIPPIIVFLALQRHFSKGLVEGAVNM